MIAKYISSFFETLCMYKIEMNLLSLTPLS